MSFTLYDDSPFLPRCFRMRKVVVKDGNNWCNVFWFGVSYFVGTLYMP